MIIRLVCLFIVSFIINAYGQRPDKGFYQKYQKCWSEKGKISLLDTVLKAMDKKKIEDHYLRHDFIQTYGCAYEEDDIERNSIRAAYRAVIQSIRNRNVSLRDNLMALLQSNPPRPDNLMREYSIYVNIPLTTELRAARYEIKILDLIAVSTIESSMSVWTRIVTRLAYKEDFNKVQVINNNESEFVEIMGKAQKILESVERKKISTIRKILYIENVAEIYPTQITDLSFGDSMYLFNESNLQKSYLGIYLGKGIFACETPTEDLTVCKLGEERLYGIRIDTNTYRRTTKIFAELNYQAPEVILQCLFLQFSHNKPQGLPSFSGLTDK